jgi:hypothetical protein
MSARLLHLPRLAEQLQQHTCFATLHIQSSRNNQSNKISQGLLHLASCRQN